MDSITPEVALKNLAGLAENALLNGPDRRVVDASVAVLAAAIKPKAE